MEPVRRIGPRPDLEPVTPVRRRRPRDERREDERDERRDETPNPPAEPAPEDGPRFLDVEA